MDENMRGLQGALAQGASLGNRSVPVWLGVGWLGGPPDTRQGPAVH